ncbi:MAG TPA: PilZ domain-containing protein [Myxococcota bacterium]|nr:PilZ domain-containing protein [Myxococcota bacterium]HRY94207.1 PilZ domain-containing protein [Myxococcota bacterium]HSA20107.1 PilZ domain-containing protein [Myxococcota bacterium]
MAERRRKDRRRVNLPIVTERRRVRRERRDDRRTHERVAAEIMVEVETSGQRTYRRTANISLGGVAFHAPIPFRLGSQVGLTLRLAGQEGGIRVDGRVVGADASGRGTRVEFVGLGPEARAALGQHLELFDASTRVGARPRLPPAVEASPQVREGVLVLQKELAGTEFRLRATERVIGRDPALADLVIDHPTVSRRHAHVYLQDGRHVLNDLSSTNGVHFRNKPVRSLVLRDGMIFRIGAVEVQYLVSRVV